MTSTLRGSSSSRRGDSPGFKLLNSSISGPRRMTFPQAKMLWSGMRRRISSWSRRNAPSPSPYRVGMLMSKRPSNEYARSSSLVVSRLAAHESRCATLKLLVTESGSCKALTLIPVMALTRSANFSFDPSTIQRLERNSRFLGAMSSWRVHPRLNHRLLRKAEWSSWGSSLEGTSARYA